MGKPQEDGVMESFFRNIRSENFTGAREKSLGFSVDKAGELSDRRDLRCI